MSEKKVGIVTSLTEKQKENLANRLKRFYPTYAEVMNAINAYLKEKPLATSGQTYNAIAHGKGLPPNYDPSKPDNQLKNRDKYISVGKRSNKKKQRHR